MTQPDGTLMQYNNGIYYWIGGKGTFIYDMLSLKTVFPNWETILKKNSGEFPGSYLSMVTLAMNAIGNNGQFTLYRFRDRTGEQIFIVRNGLFRPVINKMISDTWGVVGAPLDLPSNYVPNWAWSTEFLPVNPHRKAGSTPGDVLYKFEAPMAFEPKVTIGPFPSPAGPQNFWYFYATYQLSSINGASGEDLYIVYTDSSAQYFTVSYLVSQLNTIGQIQAFQQKASPLQFQVLMTQIAARVSTTCPSAIGSPCSLLMGTDDMSLGVQAWIGTQSSNAINAIQQNLCSNVSLKECGCINRSKDPAYNQLAGKMNSPDSCWYLPCKNSSINLIPVDLRSPTCPNICQVLYDLTNTGNVTISNNTNIITCNNPPPKPATPPTPTAPSAPPPTAPSAPPPTAPSTAPPPPPSPQVNVIQKLLSIFKKPTTPPVSFFEKLRAKLPF